MVGFYAVGNAKQIAKYMSERSNMPGIQMFYCNLFCPVCKKIVNSTLCSEDSRYIGPKCTFKIGNTSKSDSFILQMYFAGQVHI